MHLAQCLAHRRCQQLVALRILVPGPWDRGAPHSNLTCQGHPDSSGSTENGKHAAGSPHTPHQPQLPRRYTSFPNASSDTRLGAAAHTWALACTCTLTYMCVPISCRGQPGTKTSPQPGGAGRPSEAPTPCCLPACSHLCTTMSGIFLSAQLWGEVVCGAMSTACTWASARGKPA